MRSREMKTTRALIAVGIVASTLALTGCSPAADTTGLAAEITQSAGVLATTVDITHPGAPWNTELLVRIYVDDPSVESVAQKVRAIAPALARDATASSHTVGITAVQGDPSTIAASGSEGKSTLEIMVKVAGVLDVSRGGNSVLFLTPDDIARLAQPEN